MASSTLAALPEPVRTRRCRRYRRRRARWRRSENRYPPYPRCRSVTIRAPQCRTSTDSIRVPAISVALPSPALRTASEPAHQVAVAALHHDRHIAAERAERAQVGVVHVGMGEQYEIERGSSRARSAGRTRRRGPSLASPRPMPTAVSSAGSVMIQDAVQVQQHRRVAQPGGGEPVVGPGERLRPMRRRWISRLSSSHPSIKPYPETETKFTPHHARGAAAGLTERR